jgi:16S rRNA C967 or C1407 C5-methylase (RsmB/RsmF family)
MSIERYRGIIPDWDRFVETVQRPEPVTLRVRLSRIGTDELAARLEARGFRTEPVHGLPKLLRVVDGPRPVAHTLEHWQGLFYLQQTVTSLAAPVLGTSPRDRVLDMCASPGGKTTHLAELMQERGCLVAADVSEGRLKGMMGNLTRLLIPNVVTVVSDGRQFPGGALFDRILVDAPCSAEGNLRKKGGRFRPQRASFLRHVTRLQEGLLRRAIELLRPGGSVLYATCTFSPDENEAVVSRVLADTPVRMVPIELPVPSAPGLAAFEDQRFDPSLVLAHRLYPHHLDSGGLFMALLEKDGETVEGSRPQTSAGFTPAPVGETEPPPHPEAGAEDLSHPAWCPVPLTFPGASVSNAEALAWVQDGLGRLTEEFGVAPGATEGLRWMVRGDSAWMHTMDAWPVEAWEPGEWRISSVGLRGLSPDARRRLRPTNYLLRLLGDGVTHRCIPLDRGTAQRVLKRDPVLSPLDAPGYATLTLEGQVIGRASVGQAGIRHEIPKARAQRLLEILQREEAPTPEAE